MITMKFVSLKKKVQVENIFFLW